MKKKPLDGVEQKEKELIRDVTHLAEVLEGAGLRDFVRYLHSPWRIVWANLLGGVFRGLGIIIGMTLVFAILIWVLGKFVDFPLIGRYFLELKNMLEGFSPDSNFH